MESITAGAVHELASPLYKGVTRMCTRVGVYNMCFYVYINININGIVCGEIYGTRVCVCECVRVRVCACVHVCVFVFASAGIHKRKTHWIAETEEHINVSFVAITTR